jgi:hypothetical protein
METRKLNPPAAEQYSHQNFYKIETNRVLKPQK